MTSCKTTSFHDHPFGSQASGQAGGPSRFADRCLRLREVMSVTQLARPTIYKYTTCPPPGSRPFPKPLKLGRASAWLESEVMNWIEARKAARDAS